MKKHTEARTRTPVRMRWEDHGLVEVEMLLYRSDPNIMEHMSMFYAVSYSLVSAEERRSCLPSVEPESLWLSFRAGNLKKMKRNSEPSKKHDVKARMRMLRSGVRYQL
jgi:hypothetical protein